MKLADSNYMKRNHYNQNWFNYKGCIDMQQPEFKQTFCILKLTGHTFVIKYRWTIHLRIFRDKVNLHLVHGVIDFDSVITYYCSDIQNVSLAKISFLNVITGSRSRIKQWQYVWRFLYRLENLT